MERSLWDTMTGAVKGAHESIGAEAGGVLMPSVYPFLNGKPIGFAQLRPVYQGKDAAQGIAELSFLAAAVPVDEVFVAWESQDIAVACELPPLYPSSCLNLLRASPEGMVLRRMPYEERLLNGRTAEGRPRVGFDWLHQGSDIRDPELEPAIDALVGFCWDPLDLDSDDPLLTTQTYMRSLGYTVNLFA